MKLHNSNSIKPLPLHIEYFFDKKNIKELYSVTDSEFRDMIIKRRYKQGKITKEEAFMELL